VRVTTEDSYFVLDEVLMHSQRGDLPCRWGVGLIFGSHYGVIGHPSSHKANKYSTSGYATRFTAGGAIRIANYDVIDDVITPKL